MFWMYSGFVGLILFLLAGGVVASLAATKTRDDPTSHSPGKEL